MRDDLSHDDFEQLTPLNSRPVNSNQLQFKYDIVPSAANDSLMLRIPPMRRPYARVLPLYLVTYP